MPNIVITNVSQQVAPTPSTLQQTGAFISQGATNLTIGTYSLLNQLSSLTSLLNGTKAITTAVWSSNLVTVTTTAPHGFTTADTLSLTLTGFTPVGYNGTFTCTVTGASTFTYPLATNPGSMTVAGVYTEEDVAELVQMNTTFFAQGNVQAVYVLELGPGNATDGATALLTFINASPQFFYSYLVPRYWDGNAGFLTMLQSFQSLSAKTYFFVTTTTGTYSQYTALNKCVFALIESPAKTSGEFQAATAFFVTLHYQPSTTNKVTPLEYSYVYGVTPYPTFGNSVLLQTLKTAGVNVILTGAEGGISNTILVWGTTMDLNPFNYWYSVDWVQINVDLNVSNAVINGSNNPLNPLYYNSAGIASLQQVIASVMNNGVTFGLVLFTSIQVQLDGPVLSNALYLGTYNGYTIVNAVPFITYSQENPGDYKIGKYAGFSITFTPLRGFDQITVNIVATNFVVP